MKLLTHNMLACHIKGVRNNYPFLIEAAKVESKAADYDPGVGEGSETCMRPGWASPAFVFLTAAQWCADFLRHIYPRIQWPAFLQGAQSVSKSASTSPAFDVLTHPRYLLLAAWLP
jgi:multifunctional methyltransferase subunit TRM112